MLSHRKRFSAVMEHIWSQKAFRWFIILIWSSIGVSNGRSYDPRDVNGFSVKEVAGFLSQITADDAEYPPNALSTECIVAAREFPNKFSRLVADSYTESTDDTYYSYKHIRWIHRAGLCQHSVSDVWNETERTTFCEARLSDGYRVGICIPYGCRNDAKLLMDHWVSSGHGVRSEYRIATARTTENPSCLHSRWDKQWYEQPMALFDCIWTSTITALLCVASCILYYKRVHLKPKLPKEKSSPFKVIFDKVCRSYCIVTNFRRLYQRPSDKAQESTITCVHGLRVLSTWWTVLGHCYMLLVPQLSNPEALGQSLADSFVGGQIITNFTLAVDTFFVVGGTLIAYAWFRRMNRLTDSKGAADQHPTWQSVGYWLRFYRHRLIRLAPLYYLILLSVTVRVSRSTTVPAYPTSDPSVQCAANWWQNALFINSLFGSPCLPWTWYLADDFMFFLLSPVFLLLLDSRRPAIGLVALLTVGFASIGARLATQLVWNWPPTLFVWVQPPAFNQESIDYFVQVYMKPWNRITPYLIGLALGWLLNQPWTATKVVQKFRARRGLRIIGWTLATTAVLWGVFGSYPCRQGWSSSSSVGGPWWSDCYRAIYGAAHRSVFAAGVAWIIFASHSGLGPWVNRVLSWHFWFVTGQLSYAVYLFHCIPISAVYMWTQFPLEFNGTSSADDSESVSGAITHFGILRLFVVQLVFSYACSLLSTLTWEIPPINLERYFLLIRSPTTPPAPTLSPLPPVITTIAQNDGTQSEQLTPGGGNAGATAMNADELKLPQEEDSSASQML